MKMDDRSGRLEVIATLILGATTALSAWCTYQAQLWNSEQLWQMVRAGQLGAQTAEAASTVTRQALVDIMTFANVLQNEARGDRRTARSFADVARPEFRPALEAWLAKRAESGPTASTPFEDVSYRNALHKTSRDLRKQTNEVVLAASVANHNGDLFVMRTVMLALALFFAGIASQMRSRAGRRLSLSIGAVILVVTVLSLARLDRAPRPQRRTLPDPAEVLD
jgi:hypothetical protein